MGVIDLRSVSRTETNNFNTKFHLFSTQKYKMHNYLYLCGKYNQFAISF